MIALGLDCGASSSRWMLTDGGGATIAQGTAGPITGHAFTPESRAAALAALSAFAAQVAAVATPSRVVAGITGLEAGSEVAVLYARHLADAFGTAAVTVLNDMDIAYLAAFAPGEGILVYAGTGSVGYHVAADRSVTRIGGHGYLIDDAGGGFWIGRQALRHVLRARDARAAPGALDRAVAAMAGDSWDAVRAHVYGGGRAAVAALVPAVVAAADGDPAAAAILRAAGHELARLAQVLIAHVGALPVVLSGGAATCSPLILDAVRAQLPGSDVSISTAEPMAAAARLALA
jgi:N-acetylglucosamine kinase-like BadF-type ATPase